MTAVGQVPIDRTDADAAEAALQTGVRVLGAGALLGIYPEGTRSPDGRLYRGKTGVARMALDAGVPVIPVGMVNTNVIQPTGRRIPRLRPRPGVRSGRRWTSRAMPGCQVTDSSSGRSPTRSCTR